MKGLKEIIEGAIGPGELVKIGLAPIEKVFFADIVNNLS